MRRGAGALLGTLALGLAACATTPERPGTAPSGTPAIDPAALMGRWEAEWQAFPGLRAVVELTVVRRGRPQRSAGALMFSRTHLRLEVITPLGLPALIVIAGPERLLVWSLSERRAWLARPSASAMSRWIGLPVPPETLLRLLAGYVPPPPDGVPVTAAATAGGPLSFDDGGRRQRVWVTDGGQPARLQLDGAERLTATFERAVNGALMSLGVQAPGQSLEAEVRFLSAELFTPPAEAFLIQLPPGVALERLD